MMRWSSAMERLQLNRVVRMFVPALVIIFATELARQ